MSYLKVIIMKKISVLQVNKLYYPFIGGVESVVQYIAEGLKDTTNMCVLTCTEKGPTVDETVDGVQVCRTSSIGMYGNMPISLSLPRTLRKMAPSYDILQFHMPFPIGDIAGLLSGYHGKIVVWWHSDIVKQKKLMILYKPFMELFLKRADKIIVATQGHIEGSKYLKPYRDKCVVIPFGIQQDVEKSAAIYIHNKKQNTDDITYSIERKEEEKTVQFLFVGRLVYYKGCDILVEAITRLKKLTTKNVKVNIVGTGPMSDELHEMVRKNNLMNHINFLGKLTREELLKQYEECDVFVLPSVARSEAFGIVQIEAMAYGKPVINTNLDSGVPYVSIHKETGLTVEPGNPDALAGAMAYMIENDKERLMMGDRARRRVEENYQMEHMLAKLLSLYEELLKH